MANGGGAEMLSHFVGITPGAYVRSGAPGARMHSDFKDNIAQILGSVGRDVSSLSGKAQAAAVIVWLDKTNPPPEIAHYVHRRRLGRGTPEAWQSFATWRPTAARTRPSTQ